jgi:uncharacterized protein (DUF1800 family)
MKNKNNAFRITLAFSFMVFLAGCQDSSTASSSSTDTTTLIAASPETSTPTPPEVSPPTPPVNPPTPPEVEPPVTPEITPVTVNRSAINRDIVRFLNQSSFGATEDTYNQIRLQLNDDYSNSLEVYENWIDSQLDMAPTNMTDLMLGIVANTELGSATRFEREHTFWTLAVNSPDQLRHRLAQTLSELLVISDNVNSIFNAYRGITTYYDLLASSGTRTYEELLGDVTRHTTMAAYLSSLQNQKADPDKGTFPDENYAREIMQLFSFGLVHLNQDGSVILDENNQPIPTYDNHTIAEMARVFTGLGHSRVHVHATGLEIENTNFFSDQRNGGGDQGQWTHPLIMFPDYHDFGRKELFVDKGQQVIIEARDTSQAAADQELNEVIDAIVSHSSTAPRISRLLIQQLVTSNPSPAYVTRVANAFGRDGDMRATIKAILLDEEARDPDAVDLDTFGKQKSPLFQLTSFLRLTNASSEFYLDARNHNLSFTNSDRFDKDATFLRLDTDTLHVNLKARNVFNFYSPDFMPPGVLSEKALVAPETELLVGAAQVNTINEFATLISEGAVDAARSTKYTLSKDEQRVNIKRERFQQIWNSIEGDNEDKATGLVDFIDFFYNGSQIKLKNNVSSTRDIIIEAVVNSSEDDRIDTALYGIVNAPESLVQK